MKIVFITLMIITIQVNMINSAKDEPEVIIFGGKKIEWTTKAGEIMQTNNQTKKICWGIPTCCTPQAQIGCPCNCPRPPPTCPVCRIFLLFRFFRIIFLNFKNLIIIIYLKHQTPNTKRRDIASDVNARAWGHTRRVVPHKLPLDVRVIVQNLLLVVILRLSSFFSFPPFSFHSHKSHF